MKKLKTEGMRFINEDGAEVILSGINLVCKSKEKGYVEPCDESLFTWFCEQGYNVIRLGLIWDGVEPEPGVYDDVYLSKIKQQIKWAERNDIYVFLDMHQDLYSVLFSDGAPEWATLTDDLPHVTGDLWSDAYLASPAVNRALDNFWSNSLAVDGIGLQDHYTAMWQYVVSFFDGCSNIIGYDIMNEPYPGTDGQHVFGAMISVYAQNVLGMADANMEELSALWFDEQKKQKILTDIADMDTYKKLVKYAGDVSQVFEKETLAPFFNKVTNGIREIDTESIIMLETSYFANMGMESGVQLIQNDEGVIDPSQAFSPHGYDLVVDTDQYEIYNQDRVDLIFATHRKVQERLNIPTLIGEWGAFTNHATTPSLTKALIEIFERNLWGNTYWCYSSDFKEMPYIEALNRAYPQITGGQLISYHYNHDTGKVNIKYISSGLETVIYHPNAAHLSEEKIKVSGAQDYQSDIHSYPGANGGTITVVTPEKDEEITVTIG